MKARLGGTTPFAPNLMIAAAVRGRAAASRRSSSGFGVLLTNSVTTGDAQPDDAWTACGTACLDDIAEFQTG